MLKKTYDSMQLKTIALLTMLIDHIGVVWIETTHLYGIEGFQMLDVCLRLIGRLAFPLYAFLLTEGFLHTSNWKKYLGGLIGLAFLSEIPFDLAVYGKPEFGHQNVCFTMCIGLLTLKGLELLEESHLGMIPKRIGMAGLLFLGAGIAYVGRVDYSYFGVLLIVVLYLFRADHKKRCIAGGILFSFELTAILSFVMIYRYNGKKGADNIPKYVYYSFYPIHLFVLWGIKAMVNL